MQGLWKQTHTTSYYLRYCALAVVEMKCLNPSRSLHPWDQKRSQPPKASVPKSLLDVGVSQNRCPRGTLGVGFGEVPRNFVKLPHQRLLREFAPRLIVYRHVLSCLHLQTNMATHMSRTGLVCRTLELVPKKEWIHRIQPKRVKGVKSKRLTLGIQIAQCRSRAWSLEFRVTLGVQCSMVSSFEAPDTSRASQKSPFTTRLPKPQTIKLPTHYWVLLKKLKLCKQLTIIEKPRKKNKTKQLFHYASIPR